MEAKQNNSRFDSVCLFPGFPTCVFHKISIQLVTTSWMQRHDVAIRLARGIMLQDRTSGDALVLDTIASLLPEAPGTVRLKKAKTRRE